MSNGGTTLLVMLRTSEAPRPHSDGRREVTLYGARLDQVPIVGGVLSREGVMRHTANTLSRARIVGGPAVAGYILTHRPEERSYAVGVAVAAGGLTDKLDGSLSRANVAAMTDEERAYHVESGRDAAGKKLDHRADKAWVLPPMAALAMRGEISVAHPALKLLRDRRVGGIKGQYHELTGEYPSAGDTARAKTTVEMAGVAVGASPLAAVHIPGTETTLPDAIFTVSTGLSEYSAGQYADDLRRAVIEMDLQAITELAADGPVSIE